MSKTKWMMSSCFALALALLAWGCAGKAGTAIPYDEVKGQHPAAWIQDHWAEFQKSPDQCRTCHGSVTDPAQAGGISKVSCFKCHSAVVHPAGWGDHLQHGRQGAQLAPNANPTAMVGFAHCAKCHGADFAGGLSKSSCKACHTKAPHPDKPWRSLTPTASNHNATNINNAPECFKCHANGANSTLVPAVPAPAGTAPGCYNATMCHSSSF